MAAGVLLVVAGAVGLGLSAGSYLDAHADVAPGGDVAPSAGVILGAVAAGGALLLGCLLGVVGIVTLVLTARRVRRATAQGAAPSPTPTPDA